VFENISSFPEDRAVTVEASAIGTDDLVTVVFDSVTRCEGGILGPVGRVSLAPVVAGEDHGESATWSESDLTVEHIAGKVVD